MSHPFPSAEWVAALRAAINDSEPYRAASTDWTHGAVALVVSPDPGLGIEAAVAIWLDLDRGVCRDARLVPPDDAAEAPFVLTADYARWKAILRKELSPIAGILRRQLALRGSLAIVVRFVRSAEALVAAAAAVPTRFLDER